MPRRYSSFAEYDFLRRLDPLVLLVTVAVIITAASQFIFLFNFFWSMFKGARASGNPWDATTLEWATPTTPPPHDNFAGQVPTVYRGAYEFSVPGAERDFIMQHETEGEARGDDAVRGQGGKGNGHNGHGH
jgi:cytochrome c oxidase subunit 1